VTLSPQDGFALSSLRSSRAAALDDAEGFQELLFALERIGALRLGRVADLRKYEVTFAALARESPLSFEIPSRHSASHTPFDRLYSLVRTARNDALHQGAFARNLTRHAVELCLVLEDAITMKVTVISDLMVRSPVCAERWQPLSLVRQQMLAHSFSYLPVQRADDTWGLVSDLQVVQALRDPANPDRLAALSLTLQLAEASGLLSIPPAETVGPDATVEEVVGMCSGRPILVVQDTCTLLGIVTPFDLL